jgi:hypothetical protein
MFQILLHSSTQPNTKVHTPLTIIALHQPTLGTNSSMDWQPQVIGIHKDTFHPIIVLELGMALRAFHIAALWFQTT